MSEKPISFSSEMVRAILAGKKTVTRRCVKGSYAGFIPCRYQPGDILWVREPTQRYADSYTYCADKISPSIEIIPAQFMLRTAARIFLRVEDVSKQALRRDFSPEEARLEGFDSEEKFFETFCRLNNTDLISDILVWRIRFSVLEVKS